MWALGVQRAWTRALSGNGGWCWGWKVTAGVLGGLYPGKGCRAASRAPFPPDLPSERAGARGLGDTA